MDYNENGLARLVRTLPLQTILEPLRAAGLTNAQLAQALHSALNPLTTTLPVRKRLGLVFDYGISLEDGKTLWRDANSFYQIRQCPLSIQDRFVAFAAYFGLGTCEDFSQKRAADTAGLSPYRFDQLLKRFAFFVNPLSIKKTLRKPYGIRSYHYEDCIGETLRSETYQRCLDLLCAPEISDGVWTPEEAFRLGQL